MLNTEEIKTLNRSDLEPVELLLTGLPGRFGFFNRTGPVGNRPVEILDLSGKNRQKTGRVRNLELEV